jgi:transglutaminase-like putative cysteine protease
MLLSVRHETRYRYDEGALGAVMRLRLNPVDCTMQQVVDWRVTVNDEPVEAGVPNSYGVPEAIWRTGQRIDEAIVVAEGTVETVDRAGMLGFLEEAANPRVFLRQGEFTQPSPAIMALAGQARTGEGTLASLHNLCRIVHESLAYHPDTTDTATTAAQALEMGCGVCQDFAHIFLSAARLLDVPARYVAGYVHDPDQPAESHWSHGWAEAFVDGLGWVGFDPTHKVCVTDHYIRLSWGQDAFDCAPLRGVAHLAGNISMEVDVTVAAATVMKQAQAQQQ